MISLLRSTSCRRRGRLTSFVRPHAEFSVNQHAAFWLIPQQVRSLSQQLSLLIQVSITALPASDGHSQSNTTQGVRYFLDLGSIRILANSTEESSLITNLTSSADRQRDLGNLINNSSAHSHLYAPNPTPPRARSATTIWRPNPSFNSDPVGTAHLHISWNRLQVSVHPSAAGRAG